MNDNSPVFTQDLYARKVVENVAVGTTVEVIRADDADADRNGQVRYKIMAGNEAGNVSCKNTRASSFLATLLTNLNQKGLDKMCIAKPSLKCQPSPPLNQLGDG